jgi:valyl-tRNA synthetase
MDNVVQNKIFINKIWNATRFVHTNLENEAPVEKDMAKLEADLIANYDDLMFHEKWILSKLRKMSDGFSKEMDKYLFSEIGLELYAFTKNLFCDYYIEEYKLTKESSKHGAKVITYVINNLLKLWHPYIPFVTEELYSKLGFEGDLMSQKWPKVEISENKEIEKEKDIIIDTIKTIRNIRAENNVQPNKSIKLHFVSKAKNKEILEKSEYIIS